MPLTRPTAFVGSVFSIATPKEKDQGDAGDDSKDGFFVILHIIKHGFRKTAELVSKTGEGNSPNQGTQEIQQKETHRAISTGTDDKGGDIAYAIEKAEP